MLPSDIDSYKASPHLPINKNKTYRICKSYFNVRMVNFMEQQRVCRYDYVVVFWIIHAQDKYLTFSRPSLGLRTSSSDRSGLSLIIVQVRPVHHENKGHNLSSRLWRTNTFLGYLPQSQTILHLDLGLKCFASITFNACFPILNNGVFHHSGFYLRPAVKVASFKGWVSLPKHVNISELTWITSEIT